jgi:PAS domain S-box-containing protein
MTRDVAYRRKDGTPLHGVLHARASYDDEGRFVACRSVVIETGEGRRHAPDFRERREPAGDALAEMGADRAGHDLASRRMNAILESMTDGFVSLDRAWRYTYVNRRAGELLGRAPEELVGKPIWTELPGGIGQDFQRAYERAMREHVPTTVEAYYAPWDRWFENRIYPWPDGIAIFFQEITERKKAEEQMREQVARLRALSARLQLVRDEENARVARELHDDLGQGLTALKMELALLKRKLPEAMAGQATEMMAAVDALVASVRRVSTELRPAVLEDLGLAAAVDWAAKEFEKRSGVATAVTALDGAHAIPRDVSSALFRVLQEALTNVARHAHARHVEVLLDAAPGRVQVVVRDDGVGIPDAAIAAPQSIGLLGMRERMASVGGEVAIERPAAGGTVVRASAPLA